MGEELEASEIEDDCNPIVYNRDVAKDLYAYDGTTLLDGDDIANPCGLVAKSFFTDSFELYSKNPGVTYVDPDTPNEPSDPAFNADDDLIEIDDKNIAWESDVQYKFKNGGDVDGKTW